MEQRAGTHKPEAWEAEGEELRAGMTTEHKSMILSGAKADSLALAAPSGRCRPSVTSKGAGVAFELGLCRAHRFVADHQS